MTRVSPLQKVLHSIFDTPEAMRCQGYIEGTNRAGLNPRSLYLAQLAERLGTTSVEEVAAPQERSSEFGLMQNYPNPFNPSTSIPFQIPHSGFVSLKVFDVFGNEVATVIDASMNAGSHKAIVDATRFASGAYFYRLSWSGYSKAKPMLLLK